MCDSDILNPDLRAKGDPTLGTHAPVHTRIFFPLIVKQSSLNPHIGKGVFSQQRIQAGGIIVIGGGQVTSTISAAPRDFAGVYDERYYIAPLDFEKPTSNWYINHSCDSNTKVIGRLVIVARRDIAPGDELTIDYSTVAPGARGGR